MRGFSFTLLIIAGTTIAIMITGTMITTIGHTRTELGLADLIPVLGREATIVRTSEFKMTSTTV